MIECIVTVDCDGLKSRDGEGRWREEGIESCRAVWQAREAKNQYKVIRNKLIVKV